MTEEESKWTPKSGSIASGGVEVPPGHTSSNPILRTVAVYLVLCLLCLICARWPHVLLDEIRDPVLPIIKFDVSIWVPLYALKYDHVSGLGMVVRSIGNGSESDMG